MKKRFKKLISTVLLIAMITNNSLPSLALAIDAQEAMGLKTASISDAFEDEISEDEMIDDFEEESEDEMIDDFEEEPEDDMIDDFEEEPEDDMIDDFEEEPEDDMIDGFKKEPEDETIDDFEKASPSEIIDDNENDIEDEVVEDEPEEDEQEEKLKEELEEASPSECDEYIEEIASASEIIDDNEIDSEDEVVEEATISEVGLSDLLMFDTLETPLFGASPESYWYVSGTVLHIMGTKTSAYDSASKRGETYNCNSLGTITSAERKSITKVIFDNDLHPSECVGWFSGFNNVESFEGFSHLHTENVTDMSGMFNNCSKLKSIDLGSNFDTSQVTNFQSMFYDCSMLEKLDLGEKFDMRSVTDDWYLLYMISTSLKEIDMTGVTLGSKYPSMPDTLKKISISISVSNKINSMLTISAWTNASGTIYQYNELPTGVAGVYTKIENYWYVNGTELHIMGEPTAWWNFAPDTDKGALYNDASLTAAKKSSITSVVIDNEIHPLTLTGWFSGFTEITSFDLTNLYTDKVTNISNMFSNCTKLQTIDFGNDFDISAITTALSMFNNCSSLQTLDMDGVTLGSVYPSLSNCTNLEKIIINESVSNKINSMSLTGAWEDTLGNTYKCNELPIGIAGEYTKIKSYWYISGSTLYIMGMNTSAWNTASAANKGYAYKKDSLSATQKTSITSVVFVNDISPTSCKGWFSGFNKLTSIDFAKLYTNATTDLSEMFSGCEKLQTINFDSHFIMYNMSDASYMFDGCISLETVTFNCGYEPYPVKASAMFRNCKSLQTYQGISFNNVTEIDNMFYGCQSLLNADLSSYYFYALEDVSGLFYGCTNIKTIKLGDYFYTSAVDDMQNMFRDCQKLESIDFGTSFDTSNVKNMANMFYGCQKLDNLKLESNFDMNKVTDASNMFSGCTGLQYLRLSGMSLGSVAPDLAPLTNLNHIYVNSDVSNKINSMGLTGTWKNQINKMYVAGAFPVGSSGDYNKSYIYWYVSSTTLHIMGTKTTDYDSASTKGDSYDKYRLSSTVKTTITQVTFDNTVSFADCNGLFSGFNKLTDITNISNMKIDYAIDTSNMFSNCSELVDLNLGTSFDMSQVTTTTNMFTGCTKLENLDMSGVTFGTKVFDLSSCNALKKINISNSVKNKITSIGLTGKWANTAGTVYNVSSITLAGSYTKAYDVTLNNVTGAKINGTAVSGATYTINYIYGVGLTLPTAEKDSNFFEGWYTTDTGGTKVTSISATDTGDKTYYAHWKKVSKITLKSPDADTHGTTELYHKEGEGAFTDSTCNIPFNTAITKPTRTGYTFKGYKNGGIEYIKEDGTKNSTNWLNNTFNSDTELAAEWKANIYTVDLNKNSGTGGADSLFEIYNTGWSLNSDGSSPITVIPSDKLPTRTNYFFDGYYDSAIGGTQVVDKNGNISSSYSKTSTTTRNLYAHWKKRIKVNLDLDGSSGTTTLYHKEGEGAFTNEACTTPYNDCITLVSKTGYTSNGFYYSVDGKQYITSTGYKNSTNWTNNAFSSVSGFEVTLKVEWKPKVYEVVLNKEGGTGGTNTLYEVYNTGWSTDSSGSPLLSPEKISIPTKTNYIFDGYYNASTGGTQYIDKNGNISSSYSKTATTVRNLYAHWKKRITVTLNPAPGSGGTLTLYHKEGEGVFTDEACTTAFTGAITKPTRTGYTFKGYKYGTDEYIRDDGTRNTLNWGNDAFSSVTGFTVTLTAEWEQIICTIELDNDDGTMLGMLYEVYNTGWSLSSSGTPLLSPAKLPQATLPSKANHIFNGYFTSQTGGTKVVDKDGNILASVTSYTDSSITTKWYAQYLAVYNITLDDTTNGMTGGDGTIYKLENGGFYKNPTCTVSISTVSIPTKSGYTFIGYYNSASGGTQYIKANGEIIPSMFSNANINLYAQAEVNAYTITYDIGLNADTSWSATAPPRDASGHVVVNGSSIVSLTFLDATCATRVGSTLVGWKSRTDGTVYDLGATVPSTMSGNITLDASWVISPYIVKYNLNGATGLPTPSDESYTYPSSVDVALPTFASGARAGYNFAGWCHKQDCTDTSITRSPDIDARYIDSSTNTVTLYAKWEKITNKLSFDMHGHGTAIPYIDVWELEYPTKPTPDPSETNYAFDGWYTTDAYTTQYNFNHYLTADETAHAKWLEVYTIKLEKNDTTSTVVSTLYHKENAGPYTDVSCATAFTGSITIPTREGYIFRGFVENPDGTGTEYIKEDGTKGAGWTNTAFTTSKSIYAKWEAANFTIILDKNDGSGTLAGNIYEEYGVRFFDSSSTTITNVSTPSRAGFVFDGYYSASSGGTQYIDKDGNILCSNTTFVANNVRIYAHWANVYTIKINKNDGSGTIIETVYHKTGVDPYTVYKDSNCTTVFNSISSIPTRTGYIFKGVVKNSDGTGTEYITDSGSKNATNWTGSAFTSNATIYVKWDDDPNYFFVSFNSNGGSAVSRIPVLPGNTITAPANPTRSGYSFAGWYSDTGLTAAFNFSTPITASIVLNAKWNANPSPSPTPSPHNTGDNSGSSSGSGGGGGGGGTGIGIKMEQLDFVLQANNNFPTLQNGSSGLQWTGPNSNRNMPVEKSVQISVMDYSQSYTGTYKNTQEKLIGWHKFENENANTNSDEDKYFYACFTEKGVIMTGFVVDYVGDIYYLDAYNGHMTTGDKDFGNGVCKFNEYGKFVGNPFALPMDVTIFTTLKDAWRYDPISNKWSCCKVTEFGDEVKKYKNGIYSIINDASQEEFYCFDNDGNVLTGTFVFGEYIVRTDSSGRLVDMIDQRGNKAEYVLSTMDTFFPWSLPTYLLRLAMQEVIRENNVVPII